MVEIILGYPKVNFIVRWINKFTFALTTWKLDDSLPNDPKSVLIFAPHTTNWDFIIMLLAAFAIGIRPQWIGKHTIFKGPLNWFFSALGGIPLDRSKKSNMVEQSVTTIKERDQIMVTLAPEGTRSEVDHWKSGFYHIANLTQVPIHFAYIDFPTKTAGFTGGFMPSGDIDADLKIIQDFYADKRGKFPEKTGIIQLKPKNP